MKSKPSKTSLRMLQKAGLWLTEPYRNKKNLKQIKQRTHKNQSVTNIHRLNTSNVGDYYCAPHHYFDELRELPKVDILDYKNTDKTSRTAFSNLIAQNALVIGGGGLLNRDTFEKPMQLLASLHTKGKKSVVWGAGHNDPNPKTTLSSYNINVGDFGLVGTRDFSMPGEYVPCASCLHPIFDRKWNVTQETGIIFHERTLKNQGIIDQFENIPSSSNNTTLEKLIEFIGSTQTIISDSYHVMYWSMLMGKRIAVIPNSSKFFDFKYKPIFTSFDSALTDATKAVSFSGILDECREINRQFSKKVFDYLGI